jgi:hypothetical protein
LRGHGYWETAAGAEELKAGQAWLLPHAMPRTLCRPAPDLAVLLCSLPAAP